MSASNQLGLAYWLARLAENGDRITEPLMAEMAARPGFAAASTMHMRDLLAMIGTNPMASRLANDGARIMLGYLALYLDARGGLTPAAIRDTFAGLGISSPGRAIAILMQLRYYKFIEPDPHQPDRRSRRYVPTTAMIRAFIEMNAKGFLATAQVEPEAAAFARRLDDPAFLKAYILVLGESILAMVRSLKGVPRDLFADATSGYLMLYRLMLDANESVYPPRGAMRLARSALAREFRVSRAHVRRIFDLAETRGLIAYNADRSTVTFTEPFRRHLEGHHAAMFLNNFRCAQAALKQMPVATARAA
jgi:hypothetical protein